MIKNFFFEKIPLTPLSEIKDYKIRIFFVNKLFAKKHEKKRLRSKKLLFLKELNLEVKCLVYPGSNKALFKGRIKRKFTSTKKAFI